MAAPSRRRRHAHHRVIREVLIIAPLLAKVGKGVGPYQVLVEPDDPTVLHLRKVLPADSSTFREST